MSFDHDFTATHTRTRAKVDQVIAGPHRVFVVLDNDDRVAKIAQIFKCADQSIIVARVKTDRRFVQDVQHTHQSRTDLPRQSNPLALTAGKCWSGSIERQIVQPHVQQESQTVANFLDRFNRHERAR